MSHRAPLSRWALVAFLASGCAGAGEATEPVAIAAGAEDPVAPAPAEPVVATREPCRTEAEVDPPTSGDPLPPPPDVAAVPADAETTASGLASKRLVVGCGLDSPSAHSRVTVHYTGWTLDGAMFDSSVTRGSPSTFPLDGVIAGWTEGVQLMVVGEKRRFWIPAELAYGDSPRPGAPRGMLVFDVDLLAIER